MSKKLEKKLEEYLYIESVRKLKSIKDVKSLFSNPNKLEIIDDFYFNLPDITINGTSIHYIGRINESSVDNLIKITRFTIYKNKPAKLEVYVWK